MATVLLDNEQHHDIRVDTRATRDFGDLVNRAIVVSAEFNDAHKEFPILLYKGEDGIFAAHAILGFDRDENLFVQDERWISSYMPASIARGPFSLGYYRHEDDGKEAIDIKVVLDDEDPRVGTDGHPVFLELGGESPYLKGIKRVLQIVDAGMQIDKVLYPQLDEMGLLEPADIRITMSAEQEYRFTGYYTINEEKLAALTGEQLLALNRNGTLGLVYFLMSSLGNFQKLIDLKNARAEAAQA